MKKVTNIKPAEWDLTIKPKSKWYDFKISEIIRYKDLLILFVKRDFVALYKQTILGPLWFILQPAVTTITFSVIFGNLAKISTDGLPSILFYLSGITLWNYFSDTLNKTSDTFTTNAHIFSQFESCDRFLGFGNYRFLSRNR